MVPLKYLFVFFVLGRNGIFGLLITPKDEWVPDDYYDFIIIGSGSAGAVVANRLSEIRDWKVLLIEAGDPGNLLTYIPDMASMLQFTKYNWRYTMERTNGTCEGLVGQVCPWPRGRALGGTSVINFMINTRGNPIDFERWAGQGNPGWSWKEVLPYYLKSEREHLVLKDPEFHSCGGFLSNEDSFRTPIVESFLEAGRQLGYDIGDYNGRNQLRVGYVETTTRNGWRNSADAAYLRPVYGRKNLHITTGSRALKILIDDNKEAYAVKFVRNHKLHTVKITREVIVSSGALLSPQLLMLSGVGPKDHLEELGIPVIADLPGVGQNLQDHITFTGLTFILNASVAFDEQSAMRPEAFLAWLQGRGPLTSIGGVEGIAFIKTPVSRDPEPVPDIEFIFMSGSFSTDNGVLGRRIFGIPTPTYNRVWRPFQRRHTWSVFPMLLHPKSIGYLQLKSKNPFHRPKFYGNYLSDPENQDIDTFVASIKEVIRFSETPAFRKYGSWINEIPLPGCEHLHFGSDDYWRCAVRSVATTLHHQVGTCKMGPEGDPAAVVDPKLKVHGIKRLRVADTSIIPFALSSHTNVPSSMVGEKVSDIIKEFWQANIDGRPPANYSSFGSYEFGNKVTGDDQDDRGSNSLLDLYPEVLDNVAQLILGGNR